MKKIVCAFLTAVLVAALISVTSQTLQHQYTEDSQGYINYSQFMQCWTLSQNTTIQKYLCKKNYGHYRCGQFTEIINHCQEKCEREERTYEEKLNCVLHNCTKKIPKDASSQTFLQLCYNCTFTEQKAGCMGKGRIIDSDDFWNRANNFTTCFSTAYGCGDNPFCHNMIRNFNKCFLKCSQISASNTTHTADQSYYHHCIKNFCTELTSKRYFNALKYCFKQVFDEEEENR